MGIYRSGGFTRLDAFRARQQRAHNRVIWHFIRYALAAVITAQPHVADSDFGPTKIDSGVGNGCALFRHRCNVCGCRFT